MRVSTEFTFLGDLSLFFINMEILENKIYMEVWMEYGNIGIWTFYGSWQTHFWCIFRHLLGWSDIINCVFDQITYSYM